MKKFFRPTKKRTRKIKKDCIYCKQKFEPDYKELESLKHFVSERGKIVGRIDTGVCQKHQRHLTKEIKRSRFIALMPFIVRPS